MKYLTYKVPGNFNSGDTLIQCGDSVISTAAIEMVRNDQRVSDTRYVTYRVPKDFPNCESSLKCGDRTIRSKPVTIADDIKCSGCNQTAILTVLGDGPKQGRSCYVCPKNIPCDFIRWVNEIAAPLNGTSKYSEFGQGTIRKHSDAVVWCNCKNRMRARSLIVCKNTPNKGRPFYVCPYFNKGCGFVKWADEDTDNQAWRKKVNIRTIQKSRNTTKGVSRESRKCGMCRQKGHTKINCPLKIVWEHYISRCVEAR